MAMPTSAAARAGESLIPSPTMATTAPPDCSSRTCMPRHPRLWRGMPRAQKHHHGHKAGFEKQGMKSLRTPGLHQGLKDGAHDSNGEEPVHDQRGKEMGVRAGTSCSLLHSPTCFY
eukprot:1156065-Pelagomonas_calceolata.AAC.4